jgi:hypothetical protein
VTWFRVDDGFAFHHKAVGVGNAALGLWVRSGSWCSQQGNGGIVPGHMVKALGGTRQHALALVAFGLWDDLGDGSFVFHDWEHYQPTAAEVRADRLSRSEKKAEAGRLGGIASGVSRRANAKQTRSTEEAEREANGKQNEAPSLPLPSQTPSVSPPASRAATPKAVIREDWRPTDELQIWAKTECPLVDVTRETANFVDYFIDRGEKRPGWDRSWKRWMRGAQDRAEKNPRLRIVGERPDPQYAWDV